ncbi:MAG: hypothetical protein A2Y25_04430 [Candidatus Melainabacteria bacterium GWF2_37_15]|nr:MAG: hypothetical protein A2Y25_04430 [Candidatus Melainabacteria bacterium GWF2_37_15]
MSSIQPLINFTGNVADFVIKNKEILTTGAVTGILGTQTALDVKYAKKEDKNNILINNILIGLAMLAGGKLSHKCMQNFLSAKNSAKDILEALSIPVGAGIAGGITGELAQKKFPANYDKSHNFFEKAGKLKTTYGVLNNAYSIDTLDLIGQLDSSFNTVVGYTVGREKGIKKKIRKFVFEIVSGTVVPLVVLMPLNKYLDKIIPNQKKTKAGLIFGTGIVCSMVGKNIGSWINDKVTKKVIESSIWADLSKKQQELFKLSIFTHNPFEKFRIDQEIQKLTNLKSDLS